MELQDCINAELLRLDEELLKLKQQSIDAILRGDVNELKVLKNKISSINLDKQYPWLKTEKGLIFPSSALIEWVNSEEGQFIHAKLEAEY